MKVVMFDVVVVRQTGTKSFERTVVRDVPVFPDHVAFITQAVVPSDVVGPDGKAVMMVGSKIQLTSGALLIAEPKEVVLWRLANDQVELSGLPSPVVEKAEEPKLRLRRFEDGQ